MLSFVFNTRKRVSYCISVGKRESNISFTQTIYCLLSRSPIADRRGHLLGGVSLTERLRISVSNIVQLPSHQLDQKDLSRASHIRLRTRCDIRSPAVVSRQRFDTGAVYRY